MSLSAEQSKTGNRKLKQWLENDKKVITYRELSREVSCHVNHAKNLMLAYHSSHQCTATYLLTGPLLRDSTLTYTQFPVATQAETKSTQSLAHLGGQVKIVDMDQMSDGEANSEVDEDEDEPRMTNDDGADDRGALGINGAEDDHEGELESEETPRWGVVMVSEEGLEEKKQLFEQDKLSIHVYALSPAPVKDPGQYLLSNLSIRTNKDASNPAVYGTISGEGFKGSAEAMRDGGIDFGSAALASKKKPEPVVKDKKDENPEKPEKPAAKPAVSAKAPEKEDTKVKPAKVKPEPPVEAEPKASSSTTNTDGKKRRSQSPARTAATKPKAEPTAKAGPSSSQTRHEEQAAMEAMMGMDMDNDISMDQDLEESQATPGAVPASVAVKSEPKERKRKRRVVKKSKMEMDDKGYMVTKDYDTEESYSGDSEPEAPAAQTKSKAKSSAPAPPKSKPSAPPAPSRNGSSTSVDNDRKPNISKTASGALKKGAGGQSTLQGFFKKK